MTAPARSTSLQPAPSAGTANPPAAPVAAHVEAPRPAPQPDGNSPAATAALPPLRATVNTAPAEPIHKVVKTEPVKTEPSPAESKPRDAAAAKPETTPRDGAEAKLEAKPDPKPDSIEARVRAALANADAHRQAPADAHPAVAPGPAIATPVISAQPRPAENPVTRDAVATPPRTTDIAPPRSAAIAPQPAQQAPLQIAPSAPVEIKSQPVAGVDAAAAPAEADAPAVAKTEDKNPFSAFSKYLRTDTSPPPTDIPRPPMPVGQ
jgi:hypothetical protein